MSISPQHLKKLQTLANIELSAKEQKEMQQNLSSIVDLLDKLDELSLDDIDIDMQEVSMDLQQGQEDFAQRSLLLTNVEHEVSGDTIAIKSFRK